MTATGKRRPHRTVCVCSSREEGTTIPLMTGEGVKEIAPTMLLMTNATAATTHSPTTIATRRAVRCRCSWTRSTSLTSYSPAGVEVKKNTPSPESGNYFSCAFIHSAETLMSE